MLFSHIVSPAAEVVQVMWEQFRITVATLGLPVAGVFLGYKLVMKSLDVWKAKIESKRILPEV